MRHASPVLRGLPVVVASAIAITACDHGPRPDSAPGRASGSARPPGAAAAPGKPDAAAAASASARALAAPGAPGAPTACARTIHRDLAAWRSELGRSHDAKRRNALLAELALDPVDAAAELVRLDVEKASLGGGPREDRIVVARFRVASPGSTSMRVQVLRAQGDNAWCVVKGDLSTDQDFAGHACLGGDRDDPPVSVATVHLIDATRDTLRVVTEEGHCDGCGRAGHYQLSYYDASGAALARLYTLVLYDASYSGCPWPPVKEEVGSHELLGDYPRTIVATRETVCRKPEPELPDEYRQACSPKVETIQNELEGGRYVAAVQSSRDGTADSRLALADSDFRDTRRGLEWGNRCLAHLKAGQLEFARAACERGLADKPADATRGALYYNLALVEAAASDTRRGLPLSGTLAYRAPEERFRPREGRRARVQAVIRSPAVTRSSRYRLGPIPRLADIPYQPPFTEEALQAFRQIGDPLADAVIDELEKTVPIGKASDLLRIVRERADREGGVYQALLDDSMRVPAWADFDQMVAGQRLIASCAALMGLSLLTGSLVGGYVFVKAAKVTAMTGRLAMPGDISRRLAETSALVLLMSRPADIRPGGRAHETLLRVRILHGALRHWMHQSGRWRAEWDTPVNQEDLAITLSEFSYLNLRSLVRMGVVLTDAEIDSHFLLWRYAAHVLGIRELLPASFAEEERQFLPMLRHQARPLEGPEEARFILDEIADKIRFLPERVRREFFYQVTAYLVGEELVQGLGIRENPRFPGLALLRGVGRAWSFVHKRVPLGERLLHAIGQRQIDRFLADAHKQRPMTYGVTTHDREKLRAALKARRAAAA